MRLCSLAGCGRKHRGLGWCDMHLMRVRRHGDPGSVDRLRTFGNVGCGVLDCSNKHDRKGYCRQHGWLWFRYRIDPQEYEDALVRQGGVCAICGGVDAERSLAVDHDHENECIRGLLCRRCNQLLGASKDDSSILERAAKYIKDWRQTCHSEDTVVR